MWRRSFDTDEIKWCWGWVGRNGLSTLLLDTDAVCIHGQDRVCCGHHRGRRRGAAEWGEAVCITVERLNVGASSQQLGNFRGTPQAGTRGRSAVH